MANITVRRSGAQGFNYGELTNIAVADNNVTVNQAIVLVNGTLTTTEAILNRDVANNRLEIVVANHGTGGVNGTHNVASVAVHPAGRTWDLTFTFDY